MDNLKKLGFTAIFLSQLLSLSLAHANDVEEKIEILAIHSYHEGYPWTTSQYSAFKSTLEKMLPEYAIKFSSEYLDTKRIAPSDDYKKIFLNYLKTKYKNHPPKLIYTTDDNALTFLNEIDSNLPWNVPIIFSGLNNDKIAKLQWHHLITGVLEQKNIESNIELAKSLDKNVKNIVFVGDAGVTDTAMRTSIENTIKTINDINIIYISDNKLAALLNKLNKITQDVIILTSIGRIHDQHGNLYDLKNIINSITSTGKKVIVMEDSYLFPGVLGGYVTSGYLQGKYSALLASRIFRGESTANISPKTKDLSQFILSWPDMQRLDIRLNQTTLNKAKIINQPKPLTERYPHIFNLLLIAFSFLMLITVGFFISNRQKNQLLKEQTTDSLTGLPNRIKLLQHINFMSTPNFAIVDINNFKLINNLYGLKIADDLLVSLSHHLANTLNEQYLLYRLGSDKFGILADSPVTPQKFELSIIRLLKEIKEKNYQLNNLELQLTLTAGISRNDRKFIIPRAEQALQQAKQNNKEYSIIDPTITDKDSYQENIFWAHTLSKALTEKRIIPYYQPIIDNRNGTISKYEALVRLVEGDSVISPFFFLETAKSTRQYAALTKVMIEESFKTIEKYQASISINFTVEDIRNEKTIFFFKEKLNEFNVAEKVVIELTESEGIENYQEVSQFITDMKKLGCKIAIDDFGTGYSNFTHLMHLDVDYLKIDGSIIKNILTDKSAEIIAQTLVDFARRLEIKTIAEFVETKEIFDKVNELGIDFSQGYFFGKPEKELLDTNLIEQQHQS